MQRGLFGTLSAVLNRTAVLVASVSKGSGGRGTAGTTGRLADLIPFPRIPHGDIISVVPRFVNSVSGPDRSGVLKFNSLRQF
jgi:hypothetical protein